MAQDWFIIRDGKEFGPYAPQHLKDFAANGQLGPDDLVRAGNLPTPKPARSIKGLFSDQTASPNNAPAPVAPMAATESVPTTEPKKGFLDKLPVSRKLALIAGIGILVSMLLCCGIGGGLFLFSGSNKNIQLVKNGHLTGHPNTPLGKAIDRFLTNPRWESGRTKDGQNFVNVQGGMSYHNKPVQATIQFFVNPSEGSFDFQALELNGIPQNNLIMIALMNKILNEYRP